VGKATGYVIAAAAAVIFALVMANAGFPGAAILVLLALAIITVIHFLKKMTHDKYSLSFTNSRGWREENIMKALGILVLMLAAAAGAILAYDQWMKHTAGENPKGGTPSEAPEGTRNAGNINDTVQGLLDRIKLPKGVKLRPRNCVEEAGWTERKMRAYPVEFHFWYRNKLKEFVETTQDLLMKVTQMRYRTSKMLERSKDDLAIAHQTLSDYRKMLKNGDGSAWPIEDKGVVRERKEVEDMIEEGEEYLKSRKGDKQFYKRHIVDTLEPNLIMFEVGLKEIRRTARTLDATIERKKMEQNLGNFKAIQESLDLLESYKCALKDAVDGEQSAFEEKMIPRRYGSK